MEKVKVGVDVGPLKTGDKFRGIGVYTRELTASFEKLFKKITYGLRLNRLIFRANHYLYLPVIALFT